MAHGVSASEAAPTVDWQRPWFASMQVWGSQALHAWRAGAAVHAALNDLPHDAADAPAIRFVPQSALREGVAYEAHVFAQRECPTRDNLHDFFNGLCWRHWPRTKRRLNELQAARIARDGVRATRGPVRDALTLLDENGAVLIAPPVLWQALRARQWQRLFVGERHLWQQARLVIVGHALLQKLVHPRKDLTAHVWCALPPWYEVTADARPMGLADADALLADALDEKTLSAKPLTPLPVMGIPDWSPDNAYPSFYDDASVFRPPRPRPE